MTEINASTDEQWMTLALAEGAKGIGLTAPNPHVGAVLVRDGQLLGQGFHTRAGQPHAEVEALNDCRRRGNDPQGSTIYITLEPCSTRGRTPPCTTAILESGIQRVVWASDDPNPSHQGSARQILTAAGVAVTSGILTDQAEQLHRAFFKVQRTGVPWLIVKTALSLDGRITRPPGEGQWLTGPEARADVQVLRGQVDAILTSGSTARNDNPRLDYRGTRKEKKQPTRLVFSRQPQAGLPAAAHLLTPNESGPTKFLTGDLREHLTQFASEGLQTILIEAGGRLVGQLLDEGLVDEWISYFAPLICGGDVPAVAGTGVTDLEKRPRLKNVTYQQLGPDIRVHGLIAH